ncbi:MAG: ABC transporter permease [Candidatus Hodarchaeales archaeon]|jgi:ABC-2 type transport system permease protein
MSFKIYTKGLQKGWLIGILPAMLVGVFVLLIVSIWPEFKEEAAAMQDLLDNDMYKLMLGELGLLNIGTFIGFYAMEIFTILEFIMIFFTIFVPARIVSSEVDQRTLDVMLSYPVSRRDFLIQKFAVYNTITLSFPIIILITTLLGTIFVNEQIDYYPLILALIGSYLLFFTLGAISLLCGTLFLESGKSFSAAGGIIIGMWIIERLGGLSESLNFLQTISVNHYLNSGSIINSETLPIGDVFIVLMVGILSFITSLYVFEKRELAY